MRHTRSSGPADDRVESEDKVLAFRLASARGAVMVERSQSATTQAKAVSHAFLVRSVEHFWACVDADTMRFRYPLVYERTARRVAELTDGRA